MKLKEWAKKEGISYQTAYRWFKAGELPVKAYQSESGTIIVQDESSSSSESNTMNKLTTSNSDAMSVFLKKTVEFSKANSSIEDFAAYVIANFQLKINPSAPDMSLKYSKNKPSQNDVNKHFQQFIKPKHFNKDALLNSLSENTEILKEELKNNFELKDLANISYTDQVDPDSIKNFVEEAKSSAFIQPTPTSTIASSANNLDTTTAAFFSDAADFSIEPPTLLSNVQINSVVPSIGNVFVGETQINHNALFTTGNKLLGSSFQPTPRELESFRSLQETTNLSEKNELSLPIVRKAKRGRPPVKKG
jgi:hypothetical protein